MTALLVFEANVFSLIPSNHLMHHLHVLLGYLGTLLIGFQLLYLPYQLLIRLPDLLHGLIELLATLFAPLSLLEVVELPL